MLQKHRGISRIYHAFLNSKRGLSYVYRHEAAFRQELALFVVLSPFAFVIGQTLTDIILLIASLFLVLIVEVINTSVEVVVNRIGLDHHELSGLAKDLGSLAVLMALLLAGFVWIAFLTVYLHGLWGG